MCALARVCFLHFIGKHFRVCVFNARANARARACRTTVRALAVARRGPSVFIARRAVGPRVRAALALAIGRFACVHAGATWTSRTTSAPWAARIFHASVIDAAGAIYVIGGWSGTRQQDVWASTDGGADRTRAGC